MDKMAKSDHKAEANTPQQENNSPESSDYDVAMTVQRSASAAPPLNRKTIVNLQSVIGNRAVQRLLAQQGHPISKPLIQREDESAAATGQTWQPPSDFGIAGTATTKSEAWNITTEIEFKLDDLIIELEGAVDSSGVTAIKIDLANIGENIGATTEPDAPLTEDDVQRLNTTVNLAFAAYEGAIDALRQHITTSLMQIQAGNINSRVDTIASQAAEMLHTAFIQQISMDEIDKVRKVLASVDKFRGGVNKVVSWVEDINSIVENESIKSFCKKVSDFSNTVGDYKQLLDNAAVALDTLHLLSKDGALSAMENVVLLRAAVQACDTIVGSRFGKAVPLMSHIWKLYSTPTNAILDNLQKLFVDIDKIRRDQAHVALLDNAAAGIVDSYGAPFIPPEYTQFFPGGQPIFGFMYAIMNGGNPEVTIPVENFFAESADKFNTAYAEDDEQLEIEWNLIGSNKAPNVILWIHKNKQTIWAQLYGNLPSQF